MSILSIIEKALEDGIKAPSGDNCQPWFFKITANQVYIYNIPERDTSLYSWGQRSSYIAHGALIQNIKISAAANGYQTHVALFPKTTESNLVASITFQQGPTEDGMLADSIAKRTSNRKKYRDQPLTQEQRVKLLENIQNVSSVKITLIENPEQRLILGKAVAQNERILFENKEMHQFFFDHINWSTEEDTQKRTGFYIKTLELPLPIQAVFKLFKSWRVMKILSAIGFPRLIALGNAKIYSSGSAIGIVTIPDISKESFVAAGQTLEQIWLSATKLGLSFQILAGITLLKLGIDQGETKKLSTDHQRIITDAYQQITSVYNPDKQKIAILFRIGVADKPSAHTSRMKLKIQ